ncbi:MAG: PapB family radical SAM/SPASM ranthipeptide maturase [Desulfobulbaceae bacterium]
MITQSLCKHNIQVKKLEKFGSSGKHPLKAIMMLVTEQCNLRCDYCYVSKKPERMSLEIAKKSVDFLIAHADPSSKKINVCFFGGEPLLEPELIRQTCEYALEAGNSNEIHVGFSMTTNGTLLDEKCQKLLLEFGIDTTISIDGDKEIHDHHRKTVEGSGSFELIKRNLSRLLEIPKTTIRLTVTPETVYKLDSSVAYLFQLGFKKVNVAPVIEAEWDEKSLLAYYDAWDRVYILHKNLNSKEQHIGNIEKLHKKLSSPGHKDYGCGAARNMVAVDANGYFYPCHRYIGYFQNDNRRRIGDVYMGSDQKKREYYISCNYIDNHEGCGNGLFDSSIDPKNYRCSSCSLVWDCGGACMAINEYFNDNPKSPPKISRILSQIHVSMHMHYKYSDFLGIADNVLKKKGGS